MPPSLSKLLCIISITAQGVLYKNDADNGGYAVNLAHFNPNSYFIGYAGLAEKIRNRL